MRHDLTVVDAPLADLIQLPGNPHNADVDALESSVLVNGFFSPILVQRSTGHIIAGNHRYLVAVKHGWDSIPAIYLDVDDQEAKRIALADNRVAQLGHDDEADLLAFLRDLNEGDLGLEGTGYLPHNLEYLEKLINEPFTEPQITPVDNPVDEKWPRGHFEVIPNRDVDGFCTEITLSRPDFRPLTASDFNMARKQLGLQPATRAELDEYDIRGW